MLATELVSINNDQPVTTSLIVAEVFEKKHQHVLEAIRNLDCSEEFGRSNFRHISYKDTYGREQSAISMTRDGFTFLAMGFTGKKAAAWKEKFIAAFNQLEKLTQPQPLAIQGDLADMLLLAGKQLKEANQRVTLLELTNKKLEPKAECFEQFLDTKDAIPFSAFIKSIQVKHNVFGILGRNLLFKYLRDKGIIALHSSEPKQEYVSRGYFTLILIPIGKNKTVSQPLITPKGVEWLYNKLKQDPAITITLWHGDKAITHPIA